MITGTCNFVTLTAAYKYYREYGFKRADVDKKVASREIEIGEPPAQPGQRVYIVTEGRYFIETTKQEQITMKITITAQHLTGFVTFAATMLIVSNH